ncbi:MAG TPA: serine/threonine-protein kinase, partial [Planctomycetota bacterium]|nr:serine/threonine-protein kinase [Planctomycetota bacterium]
EVGGYVVLEPLGKGGFGAVYKARDEVTGRLVALKFVLPEHARDEEFLRRLRAEARAAAAFSHPNIARLYTTGEHEGRPFLVFELVPGGTLDRRIFERGALPWREACARGAEVARALAALHAAGIVHRDVKPENILLDEKGHAKLSDFGLVRLDKGRWLSVSDSMTREGAIVGTYAFMSPEQANGAKDLDGRADLYGLGALLFMLLTAHPPFEGRGMEVLAKLAKNPPPSPRAVVSDIPERLDRLVVALMAKDREARPRDAASVGRELEAIPDEIDAAAHGRSVGGRALAVFALVVLTIGAVALGRYLAPRPRVQAPVAPAPPPVPSEVEKLEAAARAGDGVSMLRLGERLEEGKGVGKDVAQAVEWYRKAALAGNTDAMLKLSERLAQGRGVAKDLASAASLLRAAGEKGNAWGMVGYANALAEGEGVSKDEAEAVAWYRKAVAAGNGAAKVRLALMLLHGQGVPRDELEAMKLLLEEVDAQNDWAMVALGDLVRARSNGAADRATALDWYRKAADHGNSLAYYRLGEMSERGEGVPLSLEEAIRWYRLARDRNGAGAQEALDRLGAK